jgi:hypothetical protein
MTKHATRAGYTSAELQLVRAAVLQLASILGDLMDEITVVGGLVPSLLSDAQVLSAGLDPHVGTADLDVALALALLVDERYAEVSERLRRAGFHPDTNENGNLVRHRWVWGLNERVKIDFILPIVGDDPKFQVFNLEPDWSALSMPGIHLAFNDRIKVSVTGHDLDGAQLTREVWVCGTAAFTVLKALALAIRGERKDAYDLVYVLQHVSGELDDVARKIRDWLPDKVVEDAVSKLRELFASTDSVGPVRSALFVYDRRDPIVEADSFAIVADLLDLLP